MNGYQHLYIPGPTNVPEPVRQAMNVPMEDMRAPDFPDLVTGLLTDMKKPTGWRMAGSLFSRLRARARGKAPSRTRCNPVTRF